MSLGVGFRAGVAVTLQWVVVELTLQSIVIDHVEACSELLIEVSEGRGRVSGFGLRLGSGLESGLGSGLGLGLESSVRVRVRVRAFVFFLRQPFLNSGSGWL